MAELSKEHREAIKTSSRVANPGCHATGFITSVYPLVAQGIIPKDYPMTVFSPDRLFRRRQKMIAEYESHGEAAELFRTPYLWSDAET